MAKSVDPDREDAVGTASASSEDSSDQPEMPVLIPQPGGRGALLSGGVPGHRGGGGRPPSAVKAALRADFDERRELLNAIADSADESTKERLKALDMMAKYGLEKGGLDQEMIQGLADVVVDEVKDPKALERIEQRWVEIIARHLT